MGFSDIRGAIFRGTHLKVFRSSFTEQQTQAASAGDHCPCNAAMTAGAGLGRPSRSCSISLEPSWMQVWFPRVADHLRRVPLRALRMCLGEVGDYAEFERLFVEEQDGAQLTAEMAFARSHPGTRARLSIAKISLTLGSWTSDL